MKLIEKNKSIWAAGLRFANMIDNIFDVVVILFLVLGIGLFGFAFTFSFSLKPLFYGGRAIGIASFPYVSEDMVEDIAQASIQVLGNLLAGGIAIVLFVIFRRAIARPRRPLGLLLLAAVCSPFFLLIASSLFDLSLCVYPFAELTRSGAELLGNPVRCDPVLGDYTPDSQVFGVFTTVYAISLIPLSLSLVPSFGLVLWKPGRRDWFGRHMFVWPYHFLANLVPVIRARITKLEVGAIAWLVALAIVLPISVMLAILPPASAAELGFVRSLLPETYQDTVVAEFFVGAYGGPGRQLLGVLVGVSIVLALFRRWVAVFAIAAAIVLYPAIIYYLFTEQYLFLESSGRSAIYFSFIFLAGWTVYIVSFVHWRRLIELVLSTCLLSGRRATKATNAKKQAIVFLRPFQLDALQAQTLPSVALRMLGLEGRSKTVEACIAREAFKVAPLVALGDPNSLTEPVGALREYTSNNTWMDRVSDLLEAPRAVIFLVGATSATKWEVDTILTTKLLRRTIFVLPRDRDISRRFFEENENLQMEMGIDHTDLLNAVDGGAAALWVGARGQVVSFISGRLDELSYSLAIAHGLAGMDE